MNTYIFDIEADELLEKATKIHCFCYYNVDTGESGALTNYEDIFWFLYYGMAKGGLTLIGHNIIRYDIPMLEKFLDIDLSGVRQIDTLPLSWYLFPNRPTHGLANWGKDLGIEKPEIEVWQDTGEPDFIPTMVHRCSEDVKINTGVWNIQLDYLQKLYSDRGDYNRAIGYIMFKMQCAREQEEEKFKLDIETAKKNLAMLEAEREKKREVLVEVMPRVNIYKIKSMPKKMQKADGTLSELGRKWYEFLDEHNLSRDTLNAVKYIDHTEPGNPNSHEQIKEWLLTLGWKPRTFTYVRPKVEGTNITDYRKPAKKIPQINNDDRTALCDSVIELFEIEPKLEELDSYYTINNRISYLTGDKGNSFLEKVDSEGFIKAEINGLTNTLRFQHKKPIVNLPQIPKLYWKEIRECLIAPDDDHILCGSDLKGLEDRTKMHYIYFHDPDYVHEMMKPDFDPHLYIALKAGLLTQKEIDFYKNYNPETAIPENKKEYSRIKGIRLKAKKTNFAAIYGAGIPKLSITAGMTINESTVFHTTYWTVNKGVKDVVSSTIWKTINLQKWLWNPVSQLWYSLKTEKDIFSTLNQSTGAYCFDTWVRYCRSFGYKLCMQYHDEHVGKIKKGEEERVGAILRLSIDRANKELQLNVPLDISIDFGRSYADIH